MGSLSLPFEELEERLDEVPKDCPDLFYCDWGSKSLSVCRSLVRMGYTCASLASGSVITGENSLTEIRGKLRIRTYAAVWDEGKALAFLQQNPEQLRTDQRDN